MDCRWFGSVRGVAKEMMYAVTLTGYLLILLAMAIVEIYARAKPQKISPLGDMLHHVMTSRTVRLGILAAWWWFGWHFLFAETVQFNL